MLYMDTGYDQRKLPLTDTGVMIHRIVSDGVMMVRQSENMILEDGENGHQTSVVSRVPVIHSQNVHSPIVYNPE